MHLIFLSFLWLRFPELPENTNRQQHHSEHHHINCGLFTEITGNESWLCLSDCPGSTFRTTLKAIVVTVGTSLMRILWNLIHFHLIQWLDQSLSWTFLSASCRSPSVTSTGTTQGKVWSMFTGNTTSPKPLECPNRSSTHSQSTYRSVSFDVPCFVSNMSSKA